MKAGRLAEGAVAVVAGGWLVLTALSQHPSRAFDRVRKLDKPGVLLPNWRFFAPEPAVHDFRLLHRVRTADGVVSDWTESVTIARRQPVQTVWYPDRRRDKAINDLCNEIISLLAAQETRIVHFPCYRLLRDHLATVVRRDSPEAVGFQWVVARTAGYDETEEPDYLFASPYQRLAPAA